MRVVLDTNILVRANPKVSSQGLARDLLLTIVPEPHALVLSSAILVEVQRVLTYPHVQARWPLTEETIDRYLVFLEAASALVDLPKSFPAIVSDPDDDPILQTAIVGRADILCSRDDAFQHEVVERVCSEHGIKVMDDIALKQDLRRLRSV